MAELILTAEEKAAQDWLDLNDDALGKLVKKAALVLHDKHGSDAVTATAILAMLANISHRCNSTKTVYKLGGVTHGDEELGDWQVTVERKKPKGK